MADEPENPVNNVADRPIEDEMRESYVNYAMSVIVSRALPDVRDGLKPSQRRVVYSLTDLNLNPRPAPSKESAVVVGHCMGRYHPHGDAAIYGTLGGSRRTSPRGIRSPTGTATSAPSPTRRPPPCVTPKCAWLSRRSTWSRTLTARPWTCAPNFDETTEEPTVLPSKFPTSSATARRDRRRHGDLDPAPQPLRGRGRARRVHRQPEHHGRGDLQEDPGARLPHGRR